MSALSGIRVVDFTQVIAGPYATMQLASLGASVIKVEHPRGGDQGRKMVAGNPGALDAGLAALFTSVNSGKRSLTLDLKHPQAKGVINKLVAEADVVVENFKAGAMERLGLGPDELMAVNPKLIYCRISGYGQSGPRAGAAAYDPVVQAAAGMMAVNGYEETGPTKVGFWVVDASTGMNAAFAISAALFRRTASGEGEVLDVAMLDTAVSLMSPLVGLYLNYGVEPPVTGNGSPGSGGSSQVYPTGDGFITVAAVTDAQFAAMITEAGRPDLVDDERFSRRENRIRHSAELREVLLECYAKDTSKGWEDRFAAVGVPCGQISNMPQVVADEQLAARGAFSELGALEHVNESFKAINLGFKMSSGGPSLTRMPPSLGEHTDEVLGELGLNSADISSLRESGAI